MKKTILWKTAVVTALLLTSNSANAQFLKKLAKSATSAATGTATTEASADTTKIDWSKIPVYSIQKVYVVDNQGNKVQNADGTPDYRVYLIDQFGNRRSPATVEAQQKKIKQAVGNVLLKIGGGAALGALSGLTSGGSGAAAGAAAGAATGALASIDDIKMAKKQKKSLKQQEKLLEEYQKNFTEEGKPVNASVETSKLAGFDIKEENTLSMTANDIKKEIEDNKSFTTDDSAWNF